MSTTKATAHMFSSGANSNVIINLSFLPRSATKPREFECTALHVAALYGHLPIAVVLLRANRGLLTKCTSSNRSALYLSAQAGNTAVVEVLPTLSADV